MNENKEWTAVTTQPFSVMRVRVRVRVRTRQWFEQEPE